MEVKIAFKLILSKAERDELLRDHSGYGVRQLEISHCNAVSHWLNPYSERSLLVSHAQCRFLLLTGQQPYGVDKYHTHYNDVIMGMIASQITSLMIVYSVVYSDADQRKHQSSASLAFVRRIHRGPVNSPNKRPVTRKMFPFDDVIMCWCQ